VLADEPTGNLDTATAADILALFRNMASQGTTVLIATHEADIARVIDRRIEISDGSVVSSQWLMTSDNHLTINHEARTTDH
jgi:putative ABC transport system ATP-binding protein